MNDIGNKEIFSKNFKYYLNFNSKDRAQVAQDLNIPYTTVNDWYNAVTYPRIDKIELLANYFNVKKSDLIEDKNKKTEKTEDNFEILINNYKHILTDSDRRIISAIIEERIKNDYNEIK